MSPQIELWGDIETTFFDCKSSELGEYNKLELASQGYVSRWFENLDLCFPPQKGIKLLTEWVI